MLESDHQRRAQKLDRSLISEFPAILRTVMARSAGLYVRALLAALIAIAVFFALSYASTFADRRGIAAKLEAANARGEFTATWAGWTGRAIPRAGGNDCLFFSSLLQAYPGRLAEAISARIPPAETQPAARPGDPTIPACLQLIAALERTDHADPHAVFYHRYLHGQRIFAALALAAVSPAALGWLTLVANAAVLLSVLVPALRRRDAGWRERGYAAIAATLLLFDGLWLFGIYFSFGLSDLVLAVFLACAYHLGIARGDERRFVTAVALFGTATAAFEFLTGGIPFGLALLLGVIGLDGPADRDALLRRAFHGTVIFTFAIALTFAIKLALVMLLVDPTVLADFSAALATRVGGTFAESLPPQEIAWLAAHGIDPSRLNDSYVFALAYMAVRLGYATFVIGYGSPIAGMIIMGVAVIASAVLLLRRARQVRGDHVARARWLILLASALVMPVWSVIFLNHTLLHAIWMVRPFAWFVALAGILLAWPARDRAHVRAA